MEQILVVKSSKKDVLVKNVGPTLFQSPQGAPSFMDLARAGFKGQGTSGNPVGVGGRIAGLAGMAGKGLAGLQTVNQVAHQAQAGNPLGAVLGAGYAFEANDPTGRRTATAIQGQEAQPQQLPPSTAQPHQQIGAMPNTSMGSGNVVPLSANYGYDVQDPQTTPVNVPSSLPQTSAPQGSIQLGGGHPKIAVGPQPNNIGSAERARIESQNYVSPYQAQPVQQQPAQQSMVQQPAQQQPVQHDGTLNPYFEMNVLDEHTNTNKSNANLFASTLMEKLGADTVYKMSPHQIAALSAYTFLKLS